MALRRLDQVGATETADCRRDAVYRRKKALEARPLRSRASSSRNSEMQSEDRDRPRAHSTPDCVLSCVGVQTLEPHARRCSAAQNLQRRNAWRSLPLQETWNRVPVSTQAERNGWDGSGADTRENASCSPPSTNRLRPAALLGTQKEDEAEKGRAPAEKRRRAPKDGASDFPVRQENGRIPLRKGKASSRARRARRRKNPEAAERKLAHEQRKASERENAGS